MVPSWASLDSHPLFGKKNSSKKKPEPSVVSKRKTTSSKVSTAKTSKNRKVDLTDNLAIENFMERYVVYFP